MNMITAQITKILPHPNAAKLKICFVTTGLQDEIKIVCGASNARVNMKTILAPVGGLTPLNMLIKKSIIRGEESEGMLCSAKDLGISQEAGIIDLPNHIALGTPFTEIPLHYLSSIPWYQYKLVDSFWLNLESSEIKISRNQDENLEKEKFRLISQSYFHGGKYLYRHF